MSSTSCSSLIWEGMPEGWVSSTCGPFFLGSLPGFQGSQRLRITDVSNIAKGFLTCFQTQGRTKALVVAVEHSTDFPSGESWPWSVVSCLRLAAVPSGPTIVFKPRPLSPDSSQSVKVCWVYEAWPFLLVWGTLACKLVSQLRLSWAVPHMEAPPAQSPPTFFTGIRFPQSLKASPTCPPHPCLSQVFPQRVSCTSNSVLVSAWEDLNWHSSTHRRLCWSLHTIPYYLPRLPPRNCSHILPTHFVAKVGVCWALGSILLSVHLLGVHRTTPFSIL